MQFEQDEMLKVLDCPSATEQQSTVKHMFHQECIAKWFEKKTECPLCRTQYSDKISKCAKELTNPSPSPTRPIARQTEEAKESLNQVITMVTQMQERIEQLNRSQTVSH